MEYVTWGDGRRTLLFLQGSPTSSVPSGVWASMRQRYFRPYVEAGYAVWVVTRPRGCRVGTASPTWPTTTPASSASTWAAGWIILGESFGGMVAQYLAGLHLLSEDTWRWWHPGSRSASGPRTWTGDWQRRSNDVTGRVPVPPSPSTSCRPRASNDFVASAGPSWPSPCSRRPTTHPGRRRRDGGRGGVRHATGAATIEAPTVLVAGGRDRIFARTSSRRPAPHRWCRVVWYPGKGHVATCTSAKVAGEVLDFVGARGRSAA